MLARWRRFGEKGKKTKKFQRRPLPKSDVPVDSVRIRNRRKFGVTATRVKRKPKMLKV